MRRFFGALIALALVGLAACDRPAGEQLLVPQSVSAARVPTTPPPSSSAPVTDLSQVLLLRGDAGISEQSVTKIVYQYGKLIIGANSLNIWEKPLEEPLVFTMTIKQKPYLSAELKAVKLSDGTPVTTFTAPLHLTLSYASATTPIPDPSKLKVYYVVDGVPQEVTNTAVDKKGQKLQALIWHFSEYSPGLDALDAMQ